MASNNNPAIEALTTLNTAQFVAVSALLAAGSVLADGRVKIDSAEAEDLVNDDDVLDELFQKNVLAAGVDNYYVNKITVDAVNELKIPTPPKPTIQELTSLNPKQLAATIAMISDGIAQNNSSVLISNFFAGKNAGLDLVAELLAKGVLRENKAGLIIHPATVNAIKMAGLIVG